MTENTQPRWPNALVDDETLAFIEAMEDAAVFYDPGDIVAFLEKPWHWQSEYERWVKFGRPQVDDKQWTDYVLGSFGERVGG